MECAGKGIQFLLRWLLFPFELYSLLVLQIIFLVALSLISTSSIRSSYANRVSTYLFPMEHEQKHVGYAGIFH